VNIYKSDPTSEPARIRIRVAGVVTYPAGAAYGPRTLEDHEAFWLLDGGAAWRVDGRWLALGPGSLALVGPGSRDHLRFHSRSSTTHGWFHFSVATPGGRLATTRLPLVHQVGAEVLGALGHAVWLWDLGQAYQGAADALASALLELALVTVEVAEVTAPSPPVARALDRVRERWAAGAPERVGLAELAEAAGVSAAHLIRAFRSEVGMPPARLLRVLRLERAALMLKAGRLPLAAIAEATGFSSPFHLSQAFRARYGVSPSRFRVNPPAEPAPPLPALSAVRRLINAPLDPQP
jgi:AraC-like DNA-binding protein